MLLSQYFFKIILHVLSLLGVFDHDYWDVYMEFAKEDPKTCLCRYTVHNRGKNPATLHILPQVWLRYVYNQMSILIIRKHLFAFIDGLAKQFDVELLNLFTPWKVFIIIKRQGGDSHDSRIFFLWETIICGKPCCFVFFLE